MNILQLLYICTPWGLSTAELVCTVSILAQYYKKQALLQSESQFFLLQECERDWQAPEEAQMAFPFRDWHFLSVTSAASLAIRQEGLYK